MRVDAYASQPHYAEHLLPIWDALPADVKGTFWAEQRSSWWGPRVGPRSLNGTDLVLVAGAGDVRSIGDRPCVYVEHGAGQTYADLDPAKRWSQHYPGGVHPANVVGYVCPNEDVVAAWHGRPAVAVGCPKLDQFLPTPPAAEPRTLAITFRWACMVGPEQKPARREYAGRLPELVARWQAEGWTVLGHAHPRGQQAMTPLWRQCGIRPTWDAGQVLARAALLIADNTSLMYEAAALGRRVLALNASWYRRDVEHGLRFWSHVPGWQIDTVGQLADLNLERYVDDDPSADLRRAAVARAYAHVDGRSAHRAAAFVLDRLEALA